MIPGGLSRATSRSIPGADSGLFDDACRGSACSRPSRRDDAIDTILAHYRGELAKNGWSVTDSADGDGVDGTKDNRSVQVRARGRTSRIARRSRQRLRELSAQRSSRSANETSASLSRNVSST